MVVGIGSERGTRNDEKDLDLRNRRIEMRSSTFSSELNSLAFYLGHESNAPILCSQGCKPKI
jgi:hypothetical protein